MGATPSQGYLAAAILGNRAMVPNGVHRLVERSSMIHVETQLRSQARISRGW